MQELYTENHKLLLREMKGDIRKYKHITDIDKKTKYDEQAIFSRSFIGSIKIPGRFLQELIVSKTNTEILNS